MEWFWHVLVVCVIVIPVTVMWIAVAVEIARRDDLSGFARVAWLAFILVLPFFGPVIYLVGSWMRASRDREVEARSVVQPVENRTAEGVGS
jgi:hypothetical protein